MYEQPDSNHMSRKARKNRTTRKNIVEPPIERHQHDILTDVETGRAGIRTKRVETQSRLDWYLVRDHISLTQWTAGRQLYEKWYKAGGRLYPQGPYSIGAIRIDNGGSIVAESRLACAESVKSAAYHLGELWDIVHTVCICDQPGRNMPRLRAGLERLRGFYRL